MKGPVWVKREVVLATQEELLRAFSGIAGIRDEDMLDSALSRPINRFAYDRAGVTIHDLAAAYAYGLVRNHPFLDGNKRIGFTIALAFLELNGYIVTTPEAGSVVQTLALAARALDEAGYAVWLKANSQKATRRKK